MVEPGMLLAKAGRVCEVCCNGWLNCCWYYELIWLMS
jgi:hypothetical protein